MGDGKRAPPHRAAANRGGFWLYLRLRNVVWLFLRLGGSEMARPALRGIRMTYINPETFSPGYARDSHVRVAPPCPRRLVAAIS